ncbi:CoA pyrophosphatase [Phenylobacterium sp.]|jgi:8-oxo-dGTP pyrophosphatase MutT (NUDIX family)|uniref:CoA pyrophosphatase n=1 Tax=Phenylobacterium sp. TaxID=1871053 RepID=UPI0037C5A8C2
MTPPDLLGWLTDRLDPLHEPAPGGPVRSDFDLTPGGWPAEAGLTPRPAAVLVGLVQRPAGVSVLLTRRSDTLRSHTGQVALPGGRQDEGERPWETALREAQEEVGLDPGFVSLIGLSTPYQTGSNYLITPVVGLIREGFSLTPNPHEVADIFETPFGYLMDPANYEEREGRLPNGETRRYYATTHAEQYIWGATAGILRALRDRLYDPDDV